MAKVAQNVKFSLFETYMARVLGSAGTNMFKQTFAYIGGRLEDVNSGGIRSCGSHVSGILVMSGLLKGMHATIESTLKDMCDSGWQEIDKLRSGAVLLWEENLQTEGYICEHLGFCIDEQTAISNDGENTKVPIQHSVDYNGTRKVEKIFWHSKLDH